MSLRKQPKTKILVQFCFALFLTICLFLSSCRYLPEGGVEDVLFGSYKPPFIPVTVSISTNNEVQIEVGGTIVTPAGEISIGWERNKIHHLELILGNQIYFYPLGQNKFKVYLPNTFKGQISVNYDGADVRIIVPKPGELKFPTNNYITPQPTVSPIPTISPTTDIAATPAVTSAASESEFKWASMAFGYRPFMLAAWAYDDSNMGNVLGFIVFILRMILAIILGILDLLVTIVLGFFAIIQTFFGIKVTKFILGLIVICFIVIYIGAISQG